MARTYDVIIIGAGIMGLSTAYYLKRKGCPRVLVLEKKESWITGSTARANGGFRQQFSTEINVRLSQISLPVFEHFEEEFDTDIGLRQYGYLFLTATEAGEEALRENMKLQKSLNVPVEWLSCQDIRQMAPFIKTDDLRGGTFGTKDGYADSYSIAEGFGRKARQLSAQVQVDEPVIEILTSSDRVEGLRTPTETFLAPKIVNAAGPHASEIGKMVNLDIPVKPVRRMLVMTEDFPAVPEQIPMIIDLETGFLMRSESGKVLMGWADPDEPPGFNLSFDPTFLEVIAPKASARAPILERAEVDPRRCWAGLYEVTPDHHCILGESHSVEGFFLINGFSGHGMMHSPAAGMILADLIMEGHTDLIDPHPLRLSRFEEGDWIEEKVVL